MCEKVISVVYWSSTVYRLQHIFKIIYLSARVAKTINEYATINTYKKFESVQLI